MIQAVNLFRAGYFERDLQRTVLELLSYDSHANRSGAAQRAKEV
jgi:hypothetical protein